MADLRIVGVDPGPVPGIVVLEVVGRRLDRAEALQCTAGSAAYLLAALLIPDDTPALVQIERFVVGRRASRSTSAKDGETTRTLIGALRQVAATSRNSPTRDVLERTASQVKGWATDARLEAAGLLDTTKGMRHARDAARHALFAAVHEGALPDPLSKEWTR